MHNTQRFSRTLGKKEVPYIVAGAGGYANTPRAMRKLQAGLENVQLPYAAKAAGVAREFADDSNSGFLRVTVSPSELVVDYSSVWFDSPPKVNSQPVDSVTVKAPAKTKMRV
ncbi:hypothetical protein CR51_17165 [Caballeronia megalochromosomata]|nr:hypothetical protein CR51_17165 [Caballeronia megalochromosomata]